MWRVFCQIQPIIFVIFYFHTPNHKKNDKMIYIVLWIYIVFNSCSTTLASKLSFVKNSHFIIPIYLGHPWKYFSTKTTTNIWNVMRIIAITMIAHSLLQIISRMFTFDQKTLGFSFLTGCWSGSETPLDYQKSMQVIMRAVSWSNPGNNKG